MRETDRNRMAGEVQVDGVVMRRVHDALVTAYEALDDALKEKLPRDMKFRLQDAAELIDMVGHWARERMEDE